MPDWGAFAAFMQSIDAAKDTLGLRPYQECFFRGHRDTTYTLLPSLFRKRDRTDEAYWKLERRMFFEFRTRARQLYETEHTDWDVLFHMQHHGVHTRLLDWTSVFGVALFFALLGCAEDGGRTPCIWLLNPFALNYASNWQLRRLISPKYLARDEAQYRSYDYSELLLGTRPIGWNTPLAIYEHQRSERMFAQSGWFTIHGTDLRAIDVIFRDRADILKKVDVPREAIPAAQQFLSLSGIGHRQLFPDLDGLARSVCDRFGISR